jgi:hypothetical protein
MKYLFVYNHLSNFYAPRKKLGGGAYCRRCVRLSFRPSSYPLNLSSEIDVVGNKCSFSQGFVGQGLSRSFWKVQGHSEHIKEKFNFNISSYCHQRYRYEIFRNIYQVLQAIYAYGPWDQQRQPTPNPPKREIAEYLENY